MIKYKRSTDDENIESLADCKSSSVKLKEGKLSFIFSKDDLSEPLKSKNINNLQVTFVLSENFLDEEFLPAVRLIERRGKFKRTIIKYFTLKEFVNFLTSNTVYFKFYADYYNQNKCLLIVELINNGRKRVDCEADIELLVDDVIFSQE